MISAALSDALISGLILLLFSAFLRYFDPKPRLRWGTSHAFTFVVPAEDGKLNLLRTQTIFVINEGRALCEGVELHLAYRPEHFQLWPTMDYSTTTNPEGLFLIKIPSLAPKERVSVEVIESRGDLPFITRVRSTAGDAQVVVIAAMKVEPQWKLAIVGMLVLAGAFLLIWLIVSAARILISIA